MTQTERTRDIVLVGSFAVLTENLFVQDETIMKMCSIASLHQTNECIGDVNNSGVVASAIKQQTNSPSSYASAEKEIKFHF